MLVCTKQTTRCDNLNNSNLYSDRPESLTSQKGDFYDGKPPLQLAKADYRSLAEFLTKVTINRTIISLGRDAVKADRRLTTYRKITLPPSRPRRQAS
jgi:hypothetical protein